MADQKQRKEERDVPDRPGQALESGEPDVTGRSRGHVINEEGASDSGEAAEKSADKPDKSEGPHWESGRQPAVE